MKAFYNQEPGAISYMQLPDGRADVWLRKNIIETTDEEGNAIWQADEVYFRTDQDQESIMEAFETLFANGGETKTSEAPASQPTIEDRLDAVEAAIMELAEVMIDG